MHRGKVDPGISELPWGNELSRDHVDRTLDSELPQSNDCPGASITSHSHDDLLSWGNVAPGQLHCPRSSSSSSDHYEFIRIPLVFAQIVTENEF